MIRGKSQEVSEAERQAAWEEAKISDTRYCVRIRSQDDVNYGILKVRRFGSGGCGEIRIPVNNTGSRDSLITKMDSLNTLELWDNVGLDTKQKLGDGVDILDFHTTYTLGSAPDHYFVIDRRKLDGRHHERQSPDQDTQNAISLSDRIEELTAKKLVVEPLSPSIVQSL